MLLAPGTRAAVPQTAIRPLRLNPCHTFRHSFATHLPMGGYDIRTVQKLLGQTGVSTTMVCTHVLNNPGISVRSPADLLV